MKLGMPIWLIATLALLAVPRVVLHDLDIIHEGTAVNALLVFAPLLVWLIVAVAGSTNPFLSLLATGLVYGLCLALAHNVFWSRSVGDDPPRLGGNAADRLPAVGEELVFRGAATVSSLFTGVAVGTLCGAVAWAVAWLLRARAGKTHGPKYQTPKNQAGKDNA
jgi:hypothetical protein